MGAKVRCETYPYIGYLKVQVPTTNSHIVQWYIGEDPDTPLRECYIIWEDEIVEVIS